MVLGLLHLARHLHPTLRTAAALVLSYLVLRLLAPATSPGSPPVAVPAPLTPTPAPDMRFSSTVTLSFALTSTFSSLAVALPTPLVQGETCVPAFSGLVQSIRHHGHRNMGWQAVLGKKGAHKAAGALVGVKAGEYAAKAIDDIAMEWIISHDEHQPEAVFTVSSAAGLVACLGGESGLKLQAPVRHSPDAAACSPAGYSFEIRCEECDPFDDTAARCTIRSPKKGLCAEAAGDTGKLKWDQCAGREKAAYQRQLFDIGLS